MKDTFIEIDDDLTINVNYIYSIKKYMEVKIKTIINQNKKLVILNKVIIRYCIDDL